MRRKYNKYFGYIADWKFYTIAIASAFVSIPITLAWVLTMSFVADGLLGSSVYGLLMISNHLLISRMVMLKIEKFFKKNGEKMKIAELVEKIEKVLKRADDNDEDNK